MKFIRDQYWEILQIQSYNQFAEKYLQEIYLKPEVHEDVRENFRVIEKLLQFGYYEHKFFDVAYSKASLGLEMAFKQRFLELEGKRWEGDFWPLINWLTSRNYFDVYNKGFMKSILSIRNNFAHPTGGFAGAGQIHLAFYPADLINSSYEDNLLTGKRAKINRMFHEKLNSLGPGYKIRIDNETHFAFNAWLSFYNNKNIIPQVHVYIQPVYEIAKPYFEDSTFSLSPYYHWQATDIKMGEGVIFLPDITGRVLEISTITCQLEKELFLKWLEGYKDFNAKTGDEISRSSFATKTFLYHLREFHKT